MATPMMKVQAMKVMEVSCSPPCPAARMSVPPPHQRNLPSPPGRGAPAQPVPTRLHPLGRARGGDGDGTEAPPGLCVVCPPPPVMGFAPPSPKGRAVAAAAGAQLAPSPGLPPGESRPLIQAKEVVVGRRWRGRGGKIFLSTSLGGSQGRGRGGRHRAEGRFINLHTHTRARAPQSFTAGEGVPGRGGCSVTEPCATRARDGQILPRGSSKTLPRTGQTPDPP